MRRLVGGGSSANEQLTAIVGAVLIPLLAAEGATLLDVRGLLNAHAFIGMLLVPLVAVKLVSIGWRMVRYYRGAEDYVLRGPPHLAVRFLVAPALVSSTVVLFGTGVALLARDTTHGTLVGLHKASFVVWAAAFGLHLLTRTPLPYHALRARLAGTSLRIAAATLALMSGVALAVMTLPEVDHLQDSVSSRVGVDAQ